ncbi:ABC transporter substrate-binding protein [Streptococcus danieliae]|uniref:ABC transporter substrate-binding protein n=1 Tax=Streptococcus danieliae TaxID=747656 RepID=UPI0026E9A973|nr:ABC transporter substrate-binding protein [Streptococcus danieliae]
MKKSRLLKFVSSALIATLVLGACASGSSSNSSGGSKPAVEFQSKVENSGTPVENARLKIGVVTADPLTGMWNPVFFLDATDYAVLRHMTGGSAIKADEYSRFVEDDETTPVKFHLDRDKKEVTLTVHPDLKWSNGQEVTAKDIIATYKLLGNPKYETNVRYSDEYELIEGMKEYHEGSASDISGISEKDNKTVVIKFKEITPSIMWGDGIMFNYLNAEQIEQVTDFNKFAEAELNTKPLSYGPYVIDKFVNGESVLLKQNEYFYKKDEVKIKEVEIKTVAPAQASNVLKNGDVDLVDELTAGIWESSKDHKNGKILGVDELYLSYVGFKLGKFDQEKGEVVVDPNAKAADVRVRQAFAYALNRDKMNEKIYNGIRYSATGSGLYPPAVKLIHNPDAVAYDYNPEKAKELLDEAGFKDVDGDGLRENAKGEKVQFNFAIRNTGQTIDQPLADTFIQSWKDVGLDVQLVDGKLMSPKDWSQRVQADDPSIDLFQGAWGLGTNPNPQGFHGKQSQLNFQRFTSDKLNADIDKLLSEEMFDDKKLVEAYREFDNEFAMEVPWIPFSWTSKMVWVNNRVKDFDYQEYTYGELAVYQLELTADNPAK